jgi:polyhydroxyalkanoate synthesis regulator phasin
MKALKDELKQNLADLKAKSRRVLENIIAKAKDALRSGAETKNNLFDNMKRLNSDVDELSRIVSEVQKFKSDKNTSTLNERIENLSKQAEKLNNNNFQQQSGLKNLLETTEDRLKDLADELRRIQRSEQKEIDKLNPDLMKDDLTTQMME